MNEANAKTDLLLHPVVEGESDNPPTSPGEGECWIVGSSPTGAWQSNSGDIAGYQSGNWLFLSPQEGMMVLDKLLSQKRCFDGSWQAANDVSDPSGGATIDAEARAAIIDLISALRTVGILPAS